MKKYADLASRIAGDTRMRQSVTTTLEWLDEHPDQTPGRTITESEFQELMEDVTTSYQVGFTDGLYRAGGQIVPDPPKSNAERWADFLHSCGANDWDAAVLSRRIDEQGIKAPEEKS